MSSFVKLSENVVVAYRSDSRPDFFLLSPWISADRPDLPMFNSDNEPVILGLIYDPDADTFSLPSTPEE